MSSPADQLASIQTTAVAKPTTLVELAAQQNAAKNADQSQIAQQAQADVESLDGATVDGLEQVAADQQGLIAQPKNIAATRNSIFSTQNGQFVDQGVSQKTARLGSRPLNTTKSSLYANNSVEAVIAADAANQNADASAAMPSYDSLAERMAVPTPNSTEVEKVQQVAMGDTEIPVLDPQATLAATALSRQNKVMTQEVASADMSDAQQQLTTNSLPVTRQKAEKKPQTLADLFRKSSEDDFNGDRFAKKKVVTRGIPNMKTAALSDNALPGVNNANAMFPTTSDPDDEDYGEDEPAGLMQLASLPSMTRVAPNGLFVQTDKVEVGCLRPELVSMIRTIEDHYKRPAIITSGFRDPRRNRRAGGVRHSLHTMCAAADIQVQGVSKWQLADFLRSVQGRGGVGTYCHTESVHIDVGEERDWNWRCRRKKRMRG
ncbi:YcbK family protein [Rhizobium sp.]